MDRPGGIEPPTFAFGERRSQSAELWADGLTDLLALSVVRRHELAALVALAIAVHRMCSVPVFSGWTMPFLPHRLFVVVSTTEQLALFDLGPHFFFGEDEHPMHAIAPSGRVDVVDLKVVRCSTQDTSTTQIRDYTGSAIVMSSAHVVAHVLGGTGWSRTSITLIKSQEPSHFGYRSGESITTWGPARELNPPRRFTGAIARRELSGLATGTPGWSRTTDHPLRTRLLSVR